MELDSLMKSVETLKDYHFKDAAERQRAVIATRSAADALQNPMEKLMELWSGSAKDAALKVCIDLDLFVKWKAAGKTKTARQLAELVGADPVLIASIMKHLGAWNIVHEEASDSYSQTDLTLALTKSEMAAIVNLHLDILIGAFSKLPVYLKVNEYARPTDTSWTPFAYAVGYHGTLFEYFAAHPNSGHALDLAMKGISPWYGQWLEIFPSERLLEGADTDQTLVVDMGGGVGHDILTFYQKHAAVSQGRLVLQDQAHVLEKVTELPSGIQKMPHDLFKEQPVKHARAYFMHQVLHFCPDETARQMLKNLKPAMKRGSGQGSSRLLINDMVIPSTGATKQNTTMDLAMMVTQAAKERDEAMWFELLQSVGFKVVNIWRKEGLIGTVIECVLE